MKRTSAVARLEELLEYRLPQSGKQLSSVVLSRADAEKLLRYILELELQAKADG